MKRRLLTAPILATGLVLGLPGSALAFNPQPDPPRAAVSFELPVASIAVATHVSLFPPDPCHTVVATLLGSSVCSPLTGSPT